MSSRDLILFSFTRRPSLVMGTHSLSSSRGRPRPRPRPRPRSPRPLPKPPRPVEGNLQERVHGGMGDGLRKNRGTRDEREGGPTEVGIIDQPADNNDWVLSSAKRSAVME